MSASPILGHPDQLAQLLNDIATGNVAHAYLFEGPRHVGKFTVAKWFASELLLQGHDGAERDEAKHKLDKLLSSDLLVLDTLWIEDQMEDFDEIAKYSNVTQEHRKKAKSRSDTISIDDIRAIQERLYETAAGTFRCCLIRSAERMQDEAVNALLKILEEPPEGLVFILTTQSMAALLPTLISRSRVVRFARVPDRDLEPLLKNASEEDARFLSRVAQGAPGVIIRLRRDPDALRAEHTLYADAVGAWHSRSLLQCLQYLRPLQDKAQADRFALHLALALREEQLTLPPRSGERLFRLLRGMETNVNRQMLGQEFALAMTGRNDQ